MIILTDSIFFLFDINNMKKTFELKRCHIDVLLLCIIFLIGAFIVYRQINGNKIEKFYDLKQDDLSELFSVETTSVSTNICAGNTNNGHVYVFYTNWCGASKSFMGKDDKGRVVDDNATWQILKKENQFKCENDKIGMHQIDCDTEEGSKLANKFKVEYLPSLFFVTQSVNTSLDSLDKVYTEIPNDPVPNSKNFIRYNDGVFKYTGGHNLPAVKNFITSQYNQ